MFTKLGEIIDVDSAMNPQHFGTDPADIRIRRFVLSSSSFSSCCYHYRYLIVVAQGQEASGVWSDHNHLDHYSCVSDRHWLYDHRHRRRNLHTVGRLQEPIISKRNDLVGIFGCIRVAVDDYGVLLFKNCLLTKT